MDTANQEKHEIAMARFALIAPVINGTFAEASAAEYFRRVASKPIEAWGGKMRHYSPLTLEDWARKYKKDGIEALMPRERADRGRSRKLSENAVSALYALKNRFPKMNATIMYERLIEDGIIDANEVSLSTIQRFCKRCFGAKRSGGVQKDRKAFEAERVCGIWQADTLYGPSIGSPKKRVYIQSIIDDKSRTIVASKAVMADNATTFQSTLKHAVALFGLPEKLYVDNGGAYKNDQLNIICGQLGVVLLHAPVRDGAAKGKIERANRTLRTRFLSILENKDTASLEALNDALSKWVARYNTTVHTSSGRRPLDVYSAEAALIRRARSKEWLDECFMNRICRKVKGDGCVRILQTDFDCPCSYIGQSVELRYDPTDLSQVTLCDGDVRVVCFATDRILNSKTKRQKPAFGIDYTKADKVEGGTDVLPLL